MRKLMILLTAMIMGIQIISVPAFAEAGTNPWWDSWIRNTDSNFESVYANVAETYDVWNAGQGLWYTNSEMSAPGRKAKIAVNKAQGLHNMAWIEGQGDSRCMVGAVHRLPDGSYELDPNTGQPKLIATPWNWGSRGYGINETANEPIWISAAAMVNREPWNGDFVWPDDAMEPTYPDGTSALGVINNDKSDPRNYRLYDAMGQKDLNGDLRVNEASWLGAAGADLLWKLTYDNGNGTYNYTQNFYFSKDIASPWWLEYQRYAVRQLLEDGAEGFWVDNYSGWDYINTSPTSKGFGEWTVALFRDYIKEHNDVLQIDNPDSFDIRAYLKDKFREIFPDRNPDNTGDSAWNNKYWITDPIWKAFCAFKADISYQYMVDQYNMIKEEAANLGIDPDSICIMGNDISHYGFGGERGTYVDIIAAEHSPLGWSPDKRFYCEGLAPEGGSETVYKTMLAYQKGSVTAPWYYMDAAYKTYDQLAEVEYYTGLANNAVAKTGGSRSPGSGDIQTAFNKNVERFGEMYGRRSLNGSIAIVHSAQTQASYWAPKESPYDGKVPHTLDFGGWGAVMEENNIAYRVLTDYQIDEEHLNGVELLILPTLTCVKDEVVEEIKAYLERGGKLIISSADAGLKYTSEEMWLARDSAVLADLANDPKYEGQIVYYMDSIGMDHYLYVNTLFNSNKSSDYLFLLDTTYTVTTPVYTNENSETVTTMEGLSHLNIDFTFKTQKYSGFEATAYVQLKDENGWPVKTVSQKFNTGANVDKPVHMEIDIPQGCENHTIDTYVWEGTVPLTVNMTFPRTKQAVKELVPQRLEAEVEKLVESGFMPRDYELYGFSSYMRSGWNKQKDGNEYFLDLVNYNYNLSQDALTPCPGGTIYLNLAEDADFIFYDADENEGKALKAARVSEGRYKIEVPSFRMYGSIRVIPK